MMQFILMNIHVVYDLLCFVAIWHLSVLPISFKVIHFEWGDPEGAE